MSKTKYPLPDGVEPLQLFDLPGFYHRFEERIRSFPGDSIYAKLRCIYQSLLRSPETKELGNWLRTLYNQKGYYYYSDERVLRYFYNHMIASQWKQDVIDQIDVIKSRYV